jgi:hypothetical protein
LDEIAVMCGLELEPKDLAPRATKKTRRNSKSKGARSTTAPAAVCFGSLAALDCISDYDGSRSASMVVEVAPGAITVQPLAAGAARIVIPTDEMPNGLLRHDDAFPLCVEECLRSSPTSQTCARHIGLNLVLGDSVELDSGGRVLFLCETDDARARVLFWREKSDLAQLEGVSGGSYFSGLASVTELVLSSNPEEIATADMSAPIWVLPPSCFRSGAVTGLANVFLGATWLDAACDFPRRLPVDWNDKLATAQLNAAAPYFGGSELRELLLERVTLADAVQAAMRRERSRSILERPATLRWWRYLLYSSARRPSRFRGARVEARTQLGGGEIAITEKHSFEQVTYEADSLSGELRTTRVRKGRPVAAAGRKENRRADQDNDTFHAVESLTFQYDSTNRMLKVIVTSTDIHPRRRPAPLPTTQSAAVSSAEEEPDDAERLTEADETVPANRLAEMLAVSFTLGHFGKIVVLSTDAIAQTATFKVKKDATNARHTLPAGAVYTAYDRAVNGS